MRILLISDVHANPWALWAIEADAGPVDRIFFAGDAVNYGPDPSDSIMWLDQHEVVGVRGNHDHAVAFGVDPKASPAKAPLALAMRDWTRNRLTPDQTGWLLKLPRHLDVQAGGARFTMVHGTPVEPLYDYRLKPDSSEALLNALVGEVRADVLVVGHTHMPLVRSFGFLKIVNPGSVGQPLDGDPRTAYAIWEDGEISLHRAEYDRTSALDALAKTGLQANLLSELKNTLRRGAISS